MTDTPQRSPQRYRAWLVVLAAICALPMLAVYGYLALSRLLRVLGTDVSGPASLVYFVALVPYWAAARWVLRFPTVYLSLSLAALLLAVAALFPLTRSWRRYVLPVTLILLVTLFPLVYRYRPALSAAPGWRGEVLSPAGFPDSVARAARLAIEMRQCEYTLLGWSECQLYYQACCGDKVEHWVYDPAAGIAPWRVKRLPSEWDHSVLDKAALLERVRASGVWPVEQESATRQVLLDGDGLVSHCGAWTALISERPGGPQDVMVIEAVAQ
ncbi:MAG: hypothetical protein R6X16_17530 [Anaerolineae bacterium]